MGTHRYRAERFGRCIRNKSAVMPTPLAIQQLSPSWVHCIMRHLCSCL